MIPRSVVEQLDIKQDLKRVLIQMIDAMNVMERNKGRFQSDVVVMEEGKSVVVKNQDSGRFMAITVTGTSSPTITLVDRGVKAPTGE